LSTDLFRSLSEPEHLEIPMNTSNVSVLDRAAPSSPSSKKSPAAPTLNGIDLAAFEAAGMALLSNPSMAPMAFRATTTWESGTRAVTEIDGHTIGGEAYRRRHFIASDEPLEVLGTDSAPNPQDLLLAALASCMTVGFVAGCTKRGIRIDSLAVDSSLEIDLRGAFGLDPTIKPGAECIRYTIRVKADAPVEVLEEVHREVMAVSPNRFHITQPIPLESRLVVG
jgi:uncharacterized OsmC-like protein